LSGAKEPPIDPSPRITFCFPHAAPEAIARLDPDRDWRAFQQGGEAWILLTYLRLAADGAPVAIAATPPEDEEGALVVYHARHKRALADALGRLERARTIAVRGELRGWLGSADFEIVQTGGAADGRRRFHLPHWPQSGLVPRDTTRGGRLERIAYKGYANNLHRDFHGGEWSAFLAGHGIEWVSDAVPFAGAKTDRAALDWPDFHTIDAVVALRPPEVETTAKPATKLANAWLAGVPALLGPEPSYQALRRDPLDYLEIRSVAEARVAVERLLSEPGLHRAMVENGFRRAREVSPTAVTAAWRTLLEETLPPLARRRRSYRARFARAVDGLRLRAAGAA